MKMNKKKVFVTALAVSLIAILSFSTIAWFNAQDEITNTFKVADSDDPDTTPDFSVDVYEKDENGNKVEGDEYLDILPGDELHKEPVVKNTGMYDMYTRVIITLSDAATWIAAADEYDIVNSNSQVGAEWPILEKMINLNENRWKTFADSPTYDPAADTLTYVYYYYESLAPNAETEPVFTTVTIPAVLQQDDMNYGTDFTITVKAEAVQSKNIVPENKDLNSSEKAYYAFNTAAEWPAGESYSYDGK